MRVKVFIVLLVFVFMSCNDEASKDEISDITTSKRAITADDDLDVYNFNEFEKFLQKSDNKTYVVNFWATWCAPCVKELPYFEKVNQNFKDSNVEVILVSLDFPKQYEKKLIPFIRQKNLKSKVIALNDTKMNDWIPKVNKNWSGAIPATVIYNASQRKFYEKAFTYKELKDELNMFLNHK